EGDTNRRYASADEFAGGLRLGLEGEDVTLPLEEGTSATRVLDDEAATRRLEETGRTEFRPVPPPRPRREPAPPPVMGPPPAAARSRPGAFSRFARFVLAMVALVLIAAAVATAVILATDRASGVHATEVAGDTVHKVVEQFKELVHKNTE